MESQRRIAAVLALVLVCFLWAIGCASNKTSEAVIPPPNIETDIVYSRTGDIELELDIASPSEGNGSFPALVFFCGNGWGYYSSSCRGQYRYSILLAAKRGYVAVTVDYRSTNLKKDGNAVYRFPDQVFDAKCAVRWLRANARKYRIDPRRVGVIGWSSGGYLALMLGVTDPSDGLEGDCGDLGISSRVQAVVCMAGPTELVSEYRESGFPVCTRDFMGGAPEELPELYRKASPLSYVSRDDPPVLIMQGSTDGLVPVRQAILIDAQMKKIGASHSLIIKEGVGHSSFHDDPLVWEFFDKYLKPQE